ANRLTGSVREGRSSRPTRSAFPPVAGRRLIPDDSRGDLNLPHVAELPEFLRRSRVLKDDFIDFGRGAVARLKAFDGWLDATDELAELLLVIGTDGFASSATIGLVGHPLRLNAVRLRCTQLGLRGSG